MAPLNNLYNRIFLPFAAVVIVGTGMAWWLANALLTDALETRVGEQLGHAASIISSRMFPLTPEVLTRLANLQQTEVVLIAGDGSVAYSTFGPATAANAEIAGRWRDTGATAGADVLTIDGNDYLLVLRGLRTESAPAAAIAVLGSLSVTQQVARDSALTLGGIALAGVAILAWWGHRSTRAVTRPVRALSDMASAIAAGDRTVRATVTGTDETRRLANALNDMTVSISQFETELAQRNRLAALGELAARVAHEIRNPLTAIQLQAQLLTERTAGSDLQATAQRLAAEVERLDLVVASTLALGRDADVQPVPTPLNPVIEDVLELMRPSLAHRGIELSWQPGDVGEVPLDAPRFKQVIYNLLTNAADEVGNVGAIRVSTALSEKRVTVRVEDSGPGVPAGLLEAVETGAVTSTKDGGLGVGLTLSAELVRAHGGNMTLDTSAGLGGAAFHIHLPRHASSEVR